MECRSVGVWLPGPLGDLVMALPALEVLARAFPGARRVGYASPVAVGLLEGQELLHRMHERTRVIPDMVRLLREERHDLLVLLTDSFRSAYIARRAGIPQRVGYRRSGRGMLLTRAVPRRRGRRPREPAPMVEIYLELLREAGLPAPATAPVRLTPTTAHRAQARELLAQAWGESADEPLVIMSPGASYGPAKCWPAHRFADVAEQLTSRRGLHARVVLLFSPQEEGLVREIQERCTHRDRVLTEGTSVGTALALLEQAQLHVTNDTGSRHLGHAVGTPTLALLGSTHREWSDYPGQVGEVLQVPVDCGPCMRRTCPLEVHRCMVDISVDWVMARALSYLRSG